MNVEFLDRDLSVKPINAFIDPPWRTQQSSRHKSGVALRFPRISRIRWDKPAAEAATLDDMRVFLEAT